MSIEIRQGGGHIARVKELPRGAFGKLIVLDKITVERDRKGILSAVGGECLFDPELFQKISDYTQSQPTAPSPGQIYRKALNWPALRPVSHPQHQGEDPNWFFYLCVRTPDSRPKYEKSVDHVPFHVTFLD